MGICPTARRHNMSFSTLRVWMMQDFGIIYVQQCIVVAIVVVAHSMEVVKHV